MIILVNGAFGVGKTTAAERLHSEIDNSMIYDPEMVGFLLRELLPSDIKKQESPGGDFQDYHLWRTMVVDTARHLKAQYGKHLIVPMTIRNHSYFTYITQGFQALDAATYSFCLTASKETIHNRLLGRGEEPGNWCFQQTDGCLEAYEKDYFGEKIVTENKSIDDVIEIILSRI
ncbi:tunicamycin resistance protein [Chryseomicrobium excrementi]|uniref:Tunicamycin resistance protein n=1 Tax=Chryseomicrobium excrementi TaxID=2041346 RepID=A0A2M9EY38_9BACL|nr:AAA family ATPase [Chryseomicrobium excrementi]PJK16125.1 tunicamycin resistance protein [Chryseomicrobium excrementi]